MEQKEMKKIWEDFVYHDVISDKIRPEVLKSWQKCKRFGVSPLGGQGKRMDKELFQSVLTENRKLLETARPIMQNVYEIVEQSHFLLVLTDSAGYILETIGDKSIMCKARELRFELGALWNEEEVGSNSIGIALDQDVAIQMAGAEHYCTFHQRWTCSAVPIHGMNGEIIGCLDMSGDVNAVHPHTMGLILAAAFGIETQLASLRSTQILQNALDGSSESIILIDEERHPVWINKAAEKLLEISSSHMRELDIPLMLPDVDWTYICKRGREGQYFSNNTRLLIKGRIVYCGVTISVAAKIGNSSTFSVCLKQQEVLMNTVNRMAGNRAVYTFDSIYAKDASMRKVIALASRFAKYDGGVMITGESGTGKELFAQAIHNEGSRRKGPFVAINCASLPRDLVESELFGYEKGAFTGAKKEGNPGKFELANHGTIFLDEIGEMPLEFQAKLLRIVETRCVSRIGSTNEKSLDIRIIVATNRNLKQEIEQGRFRSDLFYRLNVLEIHIPPLRERGDDVVYCAKMFLERFNSKYPHMKKEMEPSFEQELRIYSWPGNVRELQNNMERAFYACDASSLTLQDVGWNTQQEQETIAEPSHTREVEKEVRADVVVKRVEQILAKYEGDVTAAARYLGLSRASMYRRIKTMGINPKEYRT